MHARACIPAVLHDGDFNPQIDRQAEDRAHRLGQTRPVTVYRMVTSDTVDEQIAQIAQRKLTLDAAVLRADGDGGAGGDGGGGEGAPADARESRAQESRSMAALLQGLLAAASADDVAAPGAGAGAGLVIRDSKDD